MPKKLPKSLYTAAQRKPIERELGEGWVERIEPKVHWAIKAEKGDVQLSGWSAARRSPVRLKRKDLEQALEGIKVLEALLWNGNLKECEPEYWAKIGPKELDQLRRQ